MATGNEMEVSVVVPVYNERDNLEELTARLVKVLREDGRAFEIVFVDDGSVDGSGEVVLELKGRHPEIRLIQFDGNYGQTAALDAGFRAACGRLIVMMDADLQNAPEDIPKLLEALGQCGCATGVRARRNDPWIRRISSKIANGVRNWVSGERFVDSACGLKAFRREVVERLKLYQGMHRFLPTLVRMEGFEVEEVPVGHFPRTRGRSKYNIRNRVVRALVDLFAVTWMKKRRLRYRIKEES